MVSILTVNRRHRHQECELARSLRGPPEHFCLVTWSRGLKDPVGQTLRRVCKHKDWSRGHYDYDVQISGMKLLVSRYPSDIFYLIGRDGKKKSLLWD